VFNTRRTALAAVLISTAALAGSAAPAGAAGRAADKSPPNFDVRTAPTGSQSTAGAGKSARARSAAQQRLRSSLGSSGVLDVDALTGTVRSVSRLSGALTGASSAAPATVARQWVRAHAAALGLTSADVDALGTPKTVTAPGGLTTLRFSQSVRGVPAFDSDLRAAVDKHGRLVQVGGSPARGLSVASVKPTLTAEQAMGVISKSVGGGAGPAVASRSGGARQATTFANGDIARLVLFVTAKGAVLAWHVTDQAGKKGTWDAVVDAKSGRLLHRENLTAYDATTRYYPRYPGAPHGGTATTLNLTARGWLAAGEGLLRGPFSRAYTDVDGSDDPSDENAFDEEVRPGTGGATSFEFPLVLFNGTSANTDPPNCETFAPCTWDSTKPTSWQTNRAEATMQSFAYVSTFHDHLAAPPIGFDQASGDFSDDDPVLTEADDGAQTGDDGGPLPPFLNNANMATLPDGQSPRMQMFLGSITDDRELGLFRDNNNGEDAATVYHEYTHGLSNRLVTTADGAGALGAQQAGSMGEAWSDWYAFDYLSRAGLAPDTAAPGEMDLGDFTDAIPNSVRTQPLDCPVLEPGDTPSDACPGTPDVGPGGYTYADFGKIIGFPEVHTDGEIWGETLWDLRTALIAGAGGDVAAGSDTVEALVTGGMRLSPPNPSFLDARNSILQADTALFDGANHDLIWSVFAHRGMGYFASTSDSTDSAPIADFSPPPSASTPRGTVTGKVFDSVNGLPLSGVLVGIGGQSTPGYDEALASTTGDDGRYSFTAPAHTYAAMSIQPGNGYFNEKVTNLVVTAGQTTTKDQAVRRSLAVGKKVTTNNDTGGAYACGIEGLNDGDLGTVWEIDLTVGQPNDPKPQSVVDLGKEQSISSYGLDPAEGCGSSPDSATGDFRLESSLDGTTWHTVKQGTFHDADRHRLNEVDPPADAKTARFVRLTLLSTQGNEDFWDFTELAVFGADPNVLPSGTLSAPATANPGQSVDLTAAFTDPDSAITGYDWDFDGNGTVDQTTAGPTTSTTYTTPGTRNVTVRAKDFRGGFGSAGATVAVAGPPVGTPGPNPSPAKPRILSASSKKRQARATIVCVGKCRATMRLLVSSATRKKLHLKLRTLGRKTSTITGRRTIAVKISAAQRKRLRKAGIKTIVASLRVSVMPATGASVRRTLRVRIKL
jgi:extracellular elastinolytic metalloproteinase